ncbi:hypothetical protein TIFTF001_044020 [Ficus carica]|uniref:Uncharacterized protein n=1 Tax=Ficus carica TaxID=3494 RepID=A0AA87Z6Y9_FICCA|nr:hypothetical protein TIFTF001_044020 [Ficus carica]
MMMKMFRSDIAKQVSAGSNPPTLVSDCIGQAIRAEYQINQDKEARIQILKAKKENKDATKQLQPRQNLKLHSKGQTSKSARKFKQLGKNKKRKNATSQSQQGNYPQKKTNRGGADTKCPNSQVRQKILHGSCCNQTSRLVCNRKNGVLGKDNAKVDCRKRCVTSSPPG